MKKLLIYLALPLMFACASHTPRQAVIAGKIDGFTGVKAFMLVGTQMDTVSFHEGQFVARMSLTEPMFASINIGQRAFKFYLVPGDSCFMSASLNEPEPLFTGQNAVLQNAIAQTDSRVAEQLSDMHAVFGQEKAQFEKLMDTMKLMLNAHYDSLAGAPKKLVELERARIHYALMNLRTRYPLYHSYITTNSIKAGDDDLSVLDELNPNLGKHLMFADYKDLVKRYVDYKLQGMPEYAGMEDAEEDVSMPLYFKLVDSLLIKDVAVRDFVKMNQLIAGLTYGKFYALGSMVETFVNTCGNNSYVKNVQDVYDEMMQLAPGQPAPAINGLTVKGEEVSLEQFRGKLVYVDFWATWCRPCRDELPFLEKIEDEFAGKNIVFLSVSLDAKIDEWKQMVTEKHMKGVQIHAEGAWQSEISQNYRITGIPTFYLIGADGNILIPSAPRPSSDNIRDLINSELAKL